MKYREQCMQRPEDTKALEAEGRGFEAQGTVHAKARGHKGTSEENYNYCS